MATKAKKTAVTMQASGGSKTKVKKKGTLDSALHAPAGAEKGTYHDKSTVHKLPLVASTDLVAHTQKMAEDWKMTVATPISTDSQATATPDQKPPVSVMTDVSLDANAHTDIYQETPGEAYMNPRQQAHFRRKLLRWKQQLLGGMNHTVHHLRDEVTALPDLSDRATQEEEFSVELLTRNRERKLIMKIEETLEKLDKGEENYGFCEACGVEIGIKRLDARPTASLCIDCKTLDELREKQLSN